MWYSYLPVGVYHPTPLICVYKLMHFRVFVQFMFSESVCVYLCALFNKKLSTAVDWELLAAYFVATTPQSLHKFLLRRIMIEERSLPTEYKIGTT